MSQNGFIFPNFRGKNKKSLSCHHLAGISLPQLPLGRNRSCTIFFFQGAAFGAGIAPFKVLDALPKDSFTCQAGNVGGSKNRDLPPKMERFSHGFRLVGFGWGVEPKIGGFSPKIGYQLAEKHGKWLLNC